jgi:AAA+ superfamily predicted ATPase
MPIRFKRRIRLFPGVYLNIGKTGVSTTIGPRGANINIGKSGTYLNTAILGTGVSWREKIAGITPKPKSSIQPSAVISGAGPTMLTSLQPTLPPPLPEESSNEVETSDGLIGLSEQICEMRAQRAATRLEMDAINTKMQNLKKDLENLRSKFFPNKNNIRKLEDQIYQLGDVLIELDSNLALRRSELTFDLEPSLKDQYQRVISSFIKLTKSDIIWDILAKNNTDSTGLMTGTSFVVKRQPVVFDCKQIEYIVSEYEPLHMQNANGADLYFFPACIVLLKNDNDFLLVDLKEVKFAQCMQRFVELPNMVPSDAEVVDYTWSKANKDGSPDLRYKDNIRHSIANYVSLEFTSDSGLCETYFVSNVDAARNFSNELKTYLSMLNGEEVVSDAVPVPLPSSQHCTSSQIITNEYFDLLVVVRDEVNAILATMQQDNGLLELLKARMGDGELDPKEFFLYCVTYDVVRVFFEFLGESVAVKVVEKSVLAFLVNGLRKDSEIFSNVKFENFNDLVDDVKMAELTKIYLGIGRKSSPITISIRHGDDDPLKRGAQFAVPAFLSSVESTYFDQYAVVLSRLATVIAKSDGTVSRDEEATLKKIFEMIRCPVPELMQQSIKVRTVNEDQTLEDVLEELDSLVGLESVKQEVRTLMNIAKIQKEREKLELKSPKMSFHLVLTGSPGTGKTTVARIVSKIYSKLGILNKGQLVETDKSGLIAGYLGQTPAKVNKAVDSALDGVLFIDEAYSLMQGSKDDYGSEAVATLLKRMEDDRERLIVMIAGYTEEMKLFINANSGLKSRFNKYIEFPDYIPEEMLQIFEGQCQKLDYRLEQDARNKVLELFKIAYEQRDRSFGNGRYVRNIFENSVSRQANRVASLTHLTKEILTTIVSEDIPE